MLEKTDLWFVYDGECPICCLGVDMFKIKENVGQLYIVDARVEKDHPIMQEIFDAKLNLDHGMVIKYGDQLHHGSEVLTIMAKLGAPKDWFNLSNKILYSNPKMAWLLYPLLRSIRNILIWIKGVGKINNLKKY